MINDTSSSGGESITQASLHNGRLKLRSDLRLRLSEQRGQRVYLIEDAIRSKYFYIGKAEYQFIRHLEESKSIAEALERTNAQFPDLQFGPCQASGVCHWLIQSNLVHCDYPAMAQRLASQANQLALQRRLAWMNPLLLRFPLLQPNGAIKQLGPWLGWLMSRWCMIVWLMFAGVALHCVINHWDQLSENSIGIFAPGRWLWIMLGWLALKLIHETAHGLACRRFGGDVGAAGIQFILFVPLPFVDVTSSWRFRDRWQRIFVAAAGMYAELAIAFAAVLLWFWQPVGILSDVCFNIFVMSSLTTVLFNANPLMRFDGYYILSDILEIPNLYQRGQDAVRHWTAWLIFGTRPAPRFETVRDAIVISGYGIASLLWRILLGLSILLVATTLFQGAGIALAVVAAVLWYGPSVLAFVQSLLDRSYWARMRTRRFACCAIVLVGATTLAATVLSSPARKSAACIVQYKDELVLRAACDGFVTAVHVRDGQAIASGQLLIELENKELRLELASLEFKATQLRFLSRSRQGSGMLGDYQAAQLELEGVELQLVEKREQVDQMQIRSPMNGFIDRSQLHDLVGSFVKQGEPIAIVSELSSKEIRVSIDQSDLDSIKHNVGQTVDVLLPGMPTLQTTLTSLDPRASDIPLHPSLAARYGGSLAVRARPGAPQSDDSDFELLTPSFTATIALNAPLSQLVQSGQRGTVFLRTSRESMATSAYLCCRRWIYGKLGWSSI